MPTREDRMKIIREYVREYVRHVIKESAGGEGLAVVVSHHSSRAIAVLYDVEAFLSTVPSSWREAMIDGNLDVVDSLADNVVKGYISLGSPGSHGNCDGAWIVGRAAGPGYGREVYSVGYALSPNGRLAPDRNGVTDAAYNAWASVWKKSEYKKRPMDDSSHVHALKGNEYHTDDPADDCSTYPPYMMKYGRDPNVVNHTYQGTGDEKALLAGMQARHRELVGDDPRLQAALEEAMLEAGDAFFDMHYPGTASW